MRDLLSVVPLRLSAIRRDDTQFKERIGFLEVQYVLQPMTSRLLSGAPKITSRLFSGASMTSRLLSGASKITSRFPVLQTFSRLFSIQGNPVLFTMSFAQQH